MAVAVEVAVRHKETPVVALLMEKVLQTLEENDEYAGNSSSVWPIEGRLSNRNY